MEEVVEPGDLKPGEIHVPGIFVQRVVLGGKHQKRIERLTLSDASKDSGVDPVREKIIKRAAKELEVPSMSPSVTPTSYENRGVQAQTAYPLPMPVSLHDIHVAPASAPARTRRCWCAVLPSP